MIPAPVRELGSGPPFPEGGGPSAPTSGEPDWRSLFERERRRAEEWRRGEIDWRAKARFWRRQFEIGRDKLTAARAEAREVRRAAREALSLRAEVGAAEAAAGGGGRGCAQAEHDRLAAPGGRDPANPYRGARGGACEASRESGGACQGAVRAQERAPGAGGVGPSARPTGRCRRPWPHAQAGFRKARGSSQPRGGRARRRRTARRRSPSSSSCSPPAARARSAGRGGTRWTAPRPPGRFRRHA